MVFDTNKCRIPSPQPDSQELDDLLNSYFEFLTKNWRPLEEGTYQSLSARPKINYKRLIDETVVTENPPALTVEEEKLIMIEDIELDKELINRYFIE